MEDRIKSVREENTVDLLHLLYQLWKAKYYIVACATLAMIVAGIISVFILEPNYRSETKIYIVNSNTSTLTTTDLQLGNLLMKDYQDIILSRTVLQRVGEELNLSAYEIQRKISIGSPRDNRILQIIVNDTIPERSAQIANMVREISSEQIKKIAKVRYITTIDEAIVPEVPSGPNHKKNIILGFLAGGLLALGFFAGKELMDDRIRYPEDIEMMMGKPLLGIIPLNESKRK